MSALPSTEPDFLGIPLSKFKHHILELISFNQTKELEFRFKRGEFKIDGEMICEAILAHNYKTFVWLFENAETEALIEMGKVDDVFYPVGIAIEVGTPEMFLYLLKKPEITIKLSETIFQIFKLRRKDLFDTLYLNYSVSNHLIYTPKLMKFIYNHRKDEIFWLGQIPTLTSSKERFLEMFEIILMRNRSYDVHHRLSLEDRLDFLETLSQDREVFMMAHHDSKFRPAYVNQMNGGRKKKKTIK